MGAKKKRDRPWRVANPEMAAAMRELRRSSASSPHVPAPRKGTRAVRDRKQIDEQKEG